MDIPLIYPKIPNKSDCIFKNCIAFTKYDGTCLWFSWNYNYSWSFFGTRRTKYCFHDLDIFERDHPNLKPGTINGVLDFWDVDEKLDRHLRSNSKFTQCKEVIVFAEYFGPSSFAGEHRYNELKQLVIFDVMLNGKLLSPEEFVKNFSDFNIAKVIYRGKYNGQFAEDVRNGKYNVNEGVVVKGVIDGEVKMFKIKTNDYVERLKKQFGKDWEQYK